MSAKKTKPRRRQKENFGRSLARLRRDQGLTQQQLSEQTGISRRMIAHYETREAPPRAHVLPELAQTFGLSVDELLRLPKAKSGERRHDPVPRSTTDLRLWRKLQQIQKLPQQKRRALLQVLDGFLASNAEEKK